MNPSAKPKARSQPRSAAKSRPARKTRVTPAGAKGDDLLEAYRKKRRFDVSSEPQGGRPKRRTKSLAYVIQKHRATALHYDFRLEWNGVMLSWAVPKGPSLDPADKRLA